MSGVPSSTFMPTSILSKYATSLQQEALEIAKKEMVDFRKKKEALKDEISKLHDDVKSKNDAVLRVLCPSLDNAHADFKMNESQQLEFFRRTQDEIKDSKADFEELQELMDGCKKRIQYLEEDMGLHYG